jgi:hypothetical protein
MRLGNAEDPSRIEPIVYMNITPFSVVFSLHRHWLLFIRNCDLRFYDVFSEWTITS